MDNLFKKLYYQGKNIAKSSTFDNLARKSKIKIEASMIETVTQILDLQEKQKLMLCDIEKFDHVAFSRLGKEILDYKASLVVLEDVLLKLFGEKVDNPFVDVWGMIEEEINKPQKKQQADTKEDPEKK